MENNTVGESEFNMGMDYLSRINYLLVCYNEAARLRDVHNMYLLLERVFVEIIPMMDTPDRAKCYDLMLESDEQSEKYKRFMFNIKRNRTHKGEVRPPKEVFGTFFDWEVRLRDQIKKANMLIPLKDKRLAAAKTGRKI